MNARSETFTRTYADGTVVANSYAADGLPLRTTWARGAWRESGVRYSDPSLDCALGRDAFGVLVAASNAVAQTAVMRDNPGMATNETHAITPSREEVRDNASGAVTDVYDYYWGRDLSGSLQSAGGVG